MALTRMMKVCFPGLALAASSGPWSLSRCSQYGNLRLEISKQTHTVSQQASNAPHYITHFTGASHTPGENIKLGNRGTPSKKKSGLI